MTDLDSSAFAPPSGEVRFSSPPVAEVALAIHFEEVQERSTGHFGAFWYLHLRDHYPVVADQPLAPSQLDSFDDGLSEPATPGIFFAPVSAGSRMWFLTPDQTIIVQLQRDRIVLNWRKLSEDVYPQYPKLRGELDRILRLLEAYGAEFQLWPLRVRQTEVTYINQIEREALPKEGLLASAPMNWPEWFGTPETLQLQQTFTSTGVDGSPSRLYVTVASADRTHIQLNLTCKSRPYSGEMAHALRLLDSGHDRVVHAFKAATSPELRTLWGES